MEIIVRGKHFTVSPELEDRAQNKLGHLERYLPLLSDATCDVDLAHEKAKNPERRFVAHVNVSAHGLHLHATGHAEQPEAAIDHAAQVLARQARRQKTRLYHGRQDRPREQPRVDTGLQPDVPARTKRFGIKPMSVAEATEQIEALGHSFYIFEHVDEERVAVLYRRHAGGYGLIIPDNS